MRLFIAIPLNEAVEQALGRIILVFRQAGGKIKWVEPKNVHLTLKFLGETDEKLIEPIKTAITKISKEYFSVSGFINQVGAFPNPNRPKVIWAGMKEDIPALAAMASDIEDEMYRLGFEKEERSFKSHLTLGRVKDSQQLGKIPSILKGFEITPVKAVYDRVVLFKSTLTPAGPIYEPVFEAVLKVK